MDQSLDELIASYLAGNATPEEVAQLEAMMLEDESVADALLRHCRIDSALGAMSATHFQVIEGGTNETEKPPVAKPQKRRSFAVTTIAACLAIFGLSATLLLRGNGGVSAKIVEASGAISKIYPSGQTAKLKQLVVTDGKIKLRLDSGVSIEISGNNETCFHSPMEIELKKGALTVQVGEKGKGFVVSTETAKVVDLGTRFGVAINEDGNTDVAVLSGAVEVYKPKTKNQKPEKIASLSKGEAIRVDRKHRKTRLAAIALEGNSLAVINRKGKQKPIVVDVTDSITKVDFNRFYTISPRSMAAGMRAYSTLSKPRWQALPGESFPEELIKADVVGTYSSDRIDKDLQLNLHLSKPATVYIMMDTRSALPDWLIRDFKRTPHQLRCGPWGNSAAAKDITPSEDGIRYVTYQVWSREIPNAGTLTLGPSYNKKLPRRFAMYGIAVQHLKPGSKTINK